MTSDSTTYIIVLNWNNAADTIECLDSLFQLQGGQFQVIVCDNASTDGSLTQITNWLTSNDHPYSECSESQLDQIQTAHTTPVVVIRNDRNYGYAGGNNRGLRYALAVGKPTDFAWIVNNDTLFDANALLALCQAAAVRPEISFFGSTIFNYPEKEIIQTQGGDKLFLPFSMSLPIGAGRTWKDALPAEVAEAQIGFIRGAAVFVRLSAVKQIGLMEEQYFLYFEETDWAIRARRQGLKLGYAPGSWVYHKEGASTGSSPYVRRPSPVTDYFGVKNRIVVARRLFPWWLPTVYLGLMVTLLKRLLTGQLDRAWMVITIMLGVDRPPISIK